MVFALSQIAAVVDGVVVGEVDYQVVHLANLVDASPTSLSFYTGSPKQKTLQASRAGAVIMAEQHAALFPGNKVVVVDPYLAYAQVSRLFAPKRLATGLADSARVARDTVLGANVTVGEFSSVAPQARLGDNVWLGNGVHLGRGACIGDDCVIEDRVVITASCRLGERCHISPGVVIGSSGFGYAPTPARWEKIEQLGSVCLGDDVDVGANTTIDRGALGNTVIENGVKIDNQIQIAHNVHIGEHSILAGCVAIAGSSHIGKRCQLGGRAAILGHLHIADDVTIFANSTVTKSIRTAGEYGSLVSVQPMAKWRKNLALLHQLEQLAQQLKQLRTPPRT